MTVLVEKLLAIHEWIVHLGIWNWSSELSTCRSLIVFIKKSMPQYGWKKIRIDVWNRSYKVHTYTRVQNVCPGWKTAENQVNHQNFDPILLTKKLWPFNMRMKQFFFYSEKINFKMAAKKKLIFQNRQFSKFFRENFLDWSLC